MSAGNAFYPGDRVRIVLGDSAGLSGEVISGLDACVLWMHGGPFAPPFTLQQGKVYVAALISGVRIPLALDPNQIELEPHNSP